MTVEEFLRISIECSHKFVFLRQITEEKTWHNFVTEDVFFCEKCLKEVRKEIPKQIRY